jgi:hypothetical protein
MSIVFFTTLAQHIENEEKYKEREKQYIYSLSRIFSYKLPVYGILSETHNDKNWLPRNIFPYTELLEIVCTEKEKNKSQKEFYSLKTHIYNMNLNENTWIIKVSGRYMIIDDSFVNIVKSSKENIKAIIRTCDNDTQMYTFLFALRFKFFKDFFVNFNLPNNINLEKILLLYIQSVIQENDILFLNHLGIFCNIADTNNFEYF